MLRAAGISRVVGGRTILADVSLSLDGRDRVGVVGPNGVGKSTLLRTLAGIDVPDAGTIERAPVTTTVGYLPQEPDARPGEALLDYLARRTGVAAASDRLDAATAALAADADALDAYTEALDTFLALGGDDLAARAAEVCDRVGLAAAGSATTAARFGQDVASLSGGEAARAALAAILLMRVDVLLLDEPTNNLDFAGLDLLEAFVDGFAGAVCVVSHDRAFLDRCVHRIVELDEHSRRAAAFAGGWTDYVAGRELARSQQRQAHDVAVAERDRLLDRQRRQRQWSERGVRRAKTSGEPDKNLRRKQAERSEQQTSKVRATERALERLEVVDKPWEGWRLELQLRPSARSGDVVARLDAAVVERGPFVLGPIDLEIAWQDRIGVLGPNGAGKSTLLGALLGSIPLAAGRRWLGPGVVVGELDQGRGRFDGDVAVARAVQDLTGLDRSEARSLLAKFGLGADHVARTGAELSPGERSRAIVAVLMAQGVNCLVLDEPTNHLDVEAIEQLESALTAFDGTLVVVSHDRRFLEAVELTRTVELDGGTVASDASVA
ncbi:MAG: ABC-F family ATP-binding cassette domain-containing protein [Acidimicrobiales bacterium]|nr:ABC-F family ATP-binding cassette domain-containing protein [Acidimicrobiales bacterium]